MASAPVTSGVPQGSVLGPLLFIIFMSGINSVNLSQESKLLLYTDDILLYWSVTSGNDYKFLQEDINSLSAWCNSNHLTFNEQKCKSMVVSRKMHSCRPFLLAVHPVYALASCPLQLSCAPFGRLHSLCYVVSLLKRQICLREQSALYPLVINTTQRGRGWRTRKVLPVPWKSPPHGV